MQSNEVTTSFGQIEARAMAAYGSAGSAAISFELRSERVSSERCLVQRRTISRTTVIGQPFKLEQILG